MKVFAKGFIRVVASYFAILLVIMLMPIFLITSDVSILDSLVDFVFDNHS